MTPFEIVLLVCGAVLAVTTVSVVYRMIVGPTILDRAVSTDVLVVLVVMAMGLYTAHTAAEWAGPAMLAMTGLAFISTVTFARFVAREVAAGQREMRRNSEEPDTTSGPLEAVHLHRADGGPENHMVATAEHPERGSFGADDATSAVSGDGAEDDPDTGDPGAGGPSAADPSAGDAAAADAVAADAPAHREEGQR